MSKILIAVTGGISAYKIADVISVLKKQKHEVHVIATKNALNFVTESVLNVLSDGNYIQDTPNDIVHIREAKWCDIFVCAPATANTIAKFVNRSADNLITSTFLALPNDTMKLIFPAMNTIMYHNAYQNIMALNDIDSTWVVEPEIGLLACGDIGIGKLPNTKSIIDAINYLTSTNLSHLTFPLSDYNDVKGFTIDSFSYLQYDWKKEIEVPVYPHCGSFGAIRKHDVHKGIDLYADCGEFVYTVEPGYIVDICPFTGVDANCPWWLDTKAVYIKGNSGIVVYGEINPNSSLKIGDLIGWGKVIGTVARVLKNEKGRPTSMLHLELHDQHCVHTELWEVGKPKPNGLIDPTQYLLTCNAFTNKHQTFKFIE